MMKRLIHTGYAGFFSSSRSIQFREQVNFLVSWEIRIRVDNSTAYLQIVIMMNQSQRFYASIEFILNAFLCIRNWYCYSIITIICVHRQLFSNSFSLSLMLSQCVCVCVSSRFFFILLIGISYLLSVFSSSNILLLLKCTFTVYHIELDYV